MEELKARLASIVDSSLDAIISTDLNGKISSWNRGAELVYGYTAAQAIGQSLLITYPVEIDEQESEVLDVLKSCRSLRQHETLRRHKDGHVIHVSMTVSPICDEQGHLIGTSSIERDITEHRNREEQLRLAIEQSQSAARAKGEFVANISHELRTPMNAIIGMIELALQSGQLPPILNDYLETARDSSHLLLTLVNDLLDFSRFEVGRFELDEQEFSIRRVIDNSLRALALRANDQGLELAYHVEPSIPDRLRGDPRRLRQILLNLVGNGIKFTEHGEVVVWIESLKRTPSEIQLKISVSDTGIGIPSEHLTTIFEPFTQLDNSSTRNYSGAGLGLTISRQIARQMRGDISVESRLGEGTTVRVTPWFSIAPIQITPDPGHQAELRGRRVLIVDDNATNRLILRETLKRWGVETVSVFNANAALAELQNALAENHPFDLILVDALMPGMDGLTLIRQIRQGDPSHNLPILMLSSADRIRLEQQGDHLGISAFLEKPVSQSTLREAIEISLGQTKSTPGDGKSTPSKTTHPLIVLIAEDTVANQKVARSILEARGHKVLIASNGQEALDLLQQQPVDLVLMDVQMPVMDGLQATRRIRDNSHRNIADLPIIALTAHAMKGDRTRCLQAGMDGYAAKPIDSEELIRLVETTRHDKERKLMNSQADPSLSPQTSPKSDETINVDRALARLGEGNLLLLKQLAEMYLEDIPQLLKDLEKTLETQDHEEATRLAHSIAGLSATFEALPCHAAAKSVEAAARQKDWISVKAQFPQLKEHCHNVETALQETLLK